MKKVIFASIAIAAVTLTGCNTFRGVGQDVSSAGHAVSSTATKAQSQMK
ncbi:MULTISPECIES: entericidin A/B family lipoprotein [Acinetobacter]|jgi:predicted small secreted protein|uniref:Entericidin A/B family lipoprotein n=1 Tax=Acinetobacter pollinis TaxID=2605270 RepID=A0ABU6DUY0_9GAMM|nr:MULTISPECIES: entericidin A/B family lipoprotein [Acinetobacter]MBF7689334.1 entericidin A/B family lipoprotein [Acinetobacter pollinis]MBF7694110.1 entericidin A/B family lipoprotein [Acinetobacter pollinis]MBF7696879.1 entericidin A/B family lipoprotein [Acinetobacter pollinis]MBF7701687.1 entericidin A/B family lipoprotein [Acinetobacter pollinis]MEB5477659.1 entericidin A/B family lipoprotein [Acinetobacter pollinis]